MKNDANEKEDNEVGIQVNTTSIVNLGSELKDIKKINDVVVVNHDSSTIMNFGSDIKGVCVNIQGKVQGVFYRKWTVETAYKLGLHGWVRNLKDGSVEAVFSGKSAAVESMIEKCRAGPPGARVSTIDISTYNEPVCDDFKQMPTV
ncbi:hypothetical protein KC19_11G165000 [Ceratodon purpureus]|nr:hypothetical protein KC19_11G165000 [Ceratodon purpureus]